MVSGSCGLPRCLSGGLCCRSRHVHRAARVVPLGTAIRSAAPAAKSGLAWLGSHERCWAGERRRRGGPRPAHGRRPRPARLRYPRPAACDVLVLRFVPRLVATVTPPGLIAQGGAWGHCAHALVGCRVTGPPSARGGSARWRGIGGMRCWWRSVPLSSPAQCCSCLAVPRRRRQAAAGLWPALPGGSPLPPQPPSPAPACAAPCRPRRGSARHRPALVGAPAPRPVRRPVSSPPIMAGLKASPAGPVGRQDVVEQRPGLSGRSGHTA